MGARVAAVVPALLLVAGTSLRTEASDAAASTAASIASTDSATTQPATQPVKPSLFRDPEDGAFDVSNFLSTRIGFLPLGMPITEPAVGYGLALGLSFFHDKPKVVNYPGQPPRVIMPNITSIFGAGTENGTWSAALGQIANFRDGKIRYVGAGGYASLTSTGSARATASKASRFPTPTTCCSSSRRSRSRWATAISSSARSIA